MKNLKLGEATPVGPRRGIAVIGMSGRYPGGADSIAKLWENLKSGIDGVSEARGDRWDLGHHHPDPARPDRVYTRAGGFLDRIDSFDNEFFSLSPREARQVDPQQRLLLELAWEALEDASLPLEKVAGSNTGVFIGISSNDYSSLKGPVSPDAYSNTGSAFSIAANRISYFLDLHGPSVAMDTACSSTIVSVHQACISLLAGDCSMALVGGISLLVDIQPWQGFAKASMLSPTGRCQSFDASGDGYVRSEGGGIVILKPLELAERDGDKIYGVIVGSAINSDGHTMGLSMPNVEAQESLLRRVYDGCGVAPEDVVYVEAHGTGTAVGDPIECESIGRVLGVPRTDGSSCLIGSVKSNIGHLEAASGMAGMTKALLSLHHGEVPGNLHFKTPNPKIKFDEWKLAVVTANTALPKRDKPWIIGVNSFGFGGTNAHLAIQQYRHSAMAPAEAACPDSEWQNVLLLNAQSPAALKALASSYADFLRMSPASGSSWKAICAAAALCRSQLRYRLAVSAESSFEAVDRLQEYLAGEVPRRSASGSCASAHQPVAFVYSGNGPQWWGMGRELMAASAEFRQEIVKVDAIFQPLAGWSLVAEMARPESESRTALTEFAQPLLFALQVALTAVLRSAGIHPAATMGHSVGEVAAAYVSGALTLEQATLVIYNRSMQQARTAGMGSMAALGVSVEEAQQAISQVSGWLELAASNAPKAVTVAGDPAHLEKLRAAMTEAGKFARILPLQYAFHTSAMDVIQEDLIASLASLRSQPSAIPFISTVDGGEKNGTELDSEYWWRNVREPVQFQRAVDHLLTERRIHVFLEIGPHPVLRDYILQCAKARDVAAVSLATLRRPAANRPEPDLDNLWLAICSCHANGASDLGSLFERPTPLPELPKYTFQRTRHWRGGVPLPDVHYVTERDHPLLGYRVSAIDGLWENTLDINRLPYLRDHVVQDSVVFPAAGYIESGLIAAGLLLGAGTHDIESFEILRPLTIPPHTDPLCQLSADSRDGTFQISSRSDKHAGEWTQNVRGRLSKLDTQSEERKNIDAIKASLPCYVTAAEHYAAADCRGLSYGPAFQGVKYILLSDPGASRREALAEIELPALQGAALMPYRAHPSLTDSCVQVILTLIGQKELRNCSIIPVFIGRVRSYAPVPNHLYCHVVILHETERSAQADFQFLDVEGRVVLSLLGTRCQKVDFRRGSPSSLIAEWWRPDPAWPASFTQPLEIPSPSLILSAVGDKLDTLTREFERAVFYQEIQPEFNRLAGAYAAMALADLGASSGPFNIPRLMKRGRVKADQERLLSSIIDMAESDGQLTASERGWTWNESHSPEVPAVIWSRLVHRHPRYITELLLIAKAGEHLTSTLRGEEVPADNVASLDSLFESAPFQAIYNRLVRETVQSIVSAWPENRFIRIVEIGGGGGGLTASILPVLPPNRTDYLFTDISESSLSRAEHRFGHHRFVRFARLDISQASETQDQQPGHFDLVIAGNSLHLAADLQAAIDNVRYLLTPGGLLLALENHEQRLTNLVCGQHSTWWRVDDAATRSHSRLLTEAGWQEAFDRAGFEGTATLSDGATVPSGRPSQQSVFLCRKSPMDAGAVALPAVLRSKWLLLAPVLETQSPAFTSLTASMRARNQDVSIYPFSDCELTGDLARQLLSEYGSASIVFFAGGPAGCNSALKLIQTIELERHDNPPRLSFVTNGALASPFSGPLNPDHAALWGLIRVISNEHPSLGCRLIDLHADFSRDQAGVWLAEELLRPDDETEVQLHNAMRYLNREHMASLADISAESSPKMDSLQQAFRLDFLPQGGLDSLHLRSIERIAPGPNQVEIRIHAAGLNFRDVLWAMGMLPEEAVEKGFSGPTIGMECAGEIVRAGAGSGYSVGDRVIAFASSCFASHVTTDAGSVASISNSIDFEEAATIPITFLTAYYALEHLARLAPGETVLIHGAAGGVGLAAVQIAKLKGAVVIGTAGSPAKRGVLQMMGVDHVLNSRSLEFADEVMKLTGGVGVDVVLNSLAGEAITKGLQVLRPFGRFLEIGKRDLYANSRIGLRPFRQNLSYFGIDADTLLIERPDLGRHIFRTVTSLFETGQLRPIPFQTTPISRAAEAFRAMQQSRHVGKLVITMKGELPNLLPVVRSKTSFRADATYLVTGGLGGFGLATAQWLVSEGARSIALMGRRGVVTDEARDGIAFMEKAGALVRTFAADVSIAASVKDVVATIRKEMPPLCGVIHSAAVIEDAPALNVTPELLARVLEPKMTGAWNLHQATLEDNLDLFVLYSSSSVMVGNPGQSAYVAANLYLESLAQYRHALGLAALAVCWGAIKDAGFLTRHTAVADMLKNRSGLDATPASEALAELGRLLAASATRVCVGRFNFQRLGQMLSGARAPRFLPIIPQGLAQEAQGSESLADLLKATVPDERRTLIIARIRDHAGRILGTGASQLEVDRSLAEMGLDSLMAVELAEALERDIAQPVSVMQMLSAGTISAIADLALKTLRLPDSATSFAEKQQPVAVTGGSLNSCNALPEEIVKS
jgi:acyl transferase domain-containing protein/NADPH:quinone reductase-like Zn-dependent oxidoreductase/SAM-dependent methyltransferase/aryl carrier-like protein